MNLLEEDSKQKKESNGKKVVKALLVISIIALILVIILMVVMKNVNLETSNKSYSIYVDDVDTGKETIVDEEDTKYIAIEDIASNIGYIYYNGVYNGEPTEEKENCYLKNDNKEIIEFSTLSDIAYKTTEDSIVEKQQYKLNKKVLFYNEKIYISVEDIIEVIGIAAKYNDKQSILEMYTVKNLINQYKEKQEIGTGITIDETYPNAKAIMENMLVVLENSKYGVMNTDFTYIIGSKYRTIEYDEYTKDFIVSDSNSRYGVIDSKGNGKISLKYDKLFIVNYSPLLYAVVKDQKYGIIDKDEQIIANIEYDKLACSGDTRNNINQAFIIPDLDNGASGMVVCKNSKYGIINLSTGNYILECTVDKINSRTNSQGGEDYFVVVDKQEIDLNEYINTMNTVKIVMPTSE